MAPETRFAICSKDGLHFVVENVGSGEFDFRSDHIPDNEPTPDINTACARCRQLIEAARGTH
jgi:hypothetical protein